MIINETKIQASGACKNTMYYKQFKWNIIITLLLNQF